MAVKDTLPEDRGTSRADHFDLALTALRNALWAQQIGEVGATKAMVIHTQIALAEVRAWRETLPDQGVRLDDKPAHCSDRGLLHVAAHGVLWAEGWGQQRFDGKPLSFSLRSAEAALRTLIKRHQAGA